MAILQTNMNSNNIRRATLITIGALTATLEGVAQAQSSDALIDKLVQKGILTAQEAKDLRAEADQGFAKAYQRRSGMPDWVTNVKFSGDFRGRFEENNAENSFYIDRNRFRYRVRLGLTASLVDNFEIGFRVASGNPQFNPGGTLVGGSPITANQDLNSLESRKFLWIDAAYAKWTPVKNDAWTVTGIIGKMDNPFSLSNMIWDYDIDPEGAALQVAYNINAQHKLRANGAFFVLDELNQGVGAVPSIGASHDPYVAGAQVVWEAKWGSKLETSLGLAGFGIQSRDSLSSKVQPFYNSGSTRNAATGTLKYNFDPVIGTASATYKLDHFPLYNGAFPVKLTGEYIENPGAPSNNRGYRAGLTLGKAGHKRLWEISYRYQRLEADAWFDALTDDDNGAFYATGNPQLVGTGKANGWFGGTNVKGHQVIATYSFTDYLNFTFTYYLNDLIIGAPGQKDGAGHFMADLMWKF
jgi:hypothetical protein